jgi:hypothetical protein
MRKIIFLDIDGVLKTNKIRFDIIPGIDDDCLKRLKNIIKETGVKIVLSSDWRLFKKRLIYLKQIGIDFIGITPHLKKERKYEIEEWLKNNSDVEKYAILDDKYDMLKNQKHFKPNFEEGITEKIEKEIINYFNE